MDTFSLLLKPASADCNLHCTYCFYLDHAKLYPADGTHRMSIPVLERVVSSYMKTEQPTYTFGWQGGEPTLMGLAFFEKVVELQKRFGRSGSVVCNGLQTNATLIDDEFAAFLAEYKFLVGVSLDGPSNLHDHYRTSSTGAGSHDKVMRGIEALRRHAAEFNILTLVSQANVHHPAEVYRYLVDNGLYFHQYIPCVELNGEGRRTDFSIGGKEWGEFLCAVFDEWVRHDVGRVSIRLFDSILEYLIDGRKTVCSMDTDCRQYFAVEHNGDVYPCDFFVKPELLIGNVMRDDWKAMAHSPVFAEFGRRKSSLPETCRVCDHLFLCAGDCQKHRTHAQGAPSHLCAGWKHFYRHALPKLHEIAETIRRNRADKPPTAPGRNDPCLCGSGRKFKHCCGS